MQEYINMWRNFANFEGRTDRVGYWMAVLINLVVTLVLGGLATFIGLAAYLMALYDLALIVPSLSLGVRRLRDSGHRWHCLFLPLIPVVGTIILLVFLIQPSKYSGEVKRPLL